MALSSLPIYNMDMSNVSAKATIAVYGLLSLIVNVLRLDVPHSEPREESGLISAMVVISSFLGFLALDVLVSWMYRHIPPFKNHLVFKRPFAIANLLISALWGSLMFSAAAAHNMQGAFNDDPAALCWIGGTWFVAAYVFFMAAGFVTVCSFRALRIAASRLATWRTRSH
jgi:hypothetical protein